MASTLRLKRGTTAANNRHTGQEGEPLYDTGAKTIRVHDGTTAGGTALARADMANVQNPNFDQAGSVSLTLPTGPASERPTNTVEGMIRRDSDTGKVVVAKDALGNADTWEEIVTAASGGSGFLSSAASSIPGTSETVTGARGTGTHTRGYIWVGSLLVQWGHVGAYTGLTNPTTSPQTVTATSALAFPTAILFSANQNSKDTADTFTFGANRHSMTFVSGTLGQSSSSYRSPTLSWFAIGY